MASSSSWGSHLASVSLWWVGEEEEEKEGGEQKKGGGRGARGLGGSRRREGGEQSGLVLYMAITQHKGSDRLELIVRKW